VFALLVCSNRVLFTLYDIFHLQMYYVLSTVLVSQAILNLDKLLEAILILFYFCRLTIAPSKYTPREIFVSNTLHSIFFILQCQAFTRLSWDDTAPKPVVPGTASTTYSSSSVDDVRPAQRQQQNQADAWYSPPPSSRTGY